MEKGPDTRSCGFSGSKLYSSYVESLKYHNNAVDGTFYDAIKGGAMTTIQPQGEAIKTAIKWVSEQRIDDPDMELSKLVQKAALTFDLSPADASFLERFFKESENSPS